MSVQVEGPQVSPSPVKKRKGLFWAWVPVGLLVTMLAGWAVMVSLALDDPGFAVEEDYYRKAVGWDGEQAERRASTKLGWQWNVEATPKPQGAQVALTLTDVHGEPVRGAHVQLQVFHLARGKDRLEVVLAEDEAGRYVGAAPMRRAGFWQFRLRVERGQELYVDRREVEFEGAP